MKKAKIVNMKNTVINKFYIVINLWLAVIIGVTTVIGYKTGLNGFYVASLALAISLLMFNALLFSLHIRRAIRIQPSQKEKFNR